MFFGFFMHSVSAKKRSRERERERDFGFTLIELLIVIAIIGILAAAVVVVLNPAELVKQARDTQRIADIDSLNTALKLADIDGQNLGTSTVIYLSLPDTSTTCASYALATSTGYTYHCSPTSTYQKADGTGWIPVNFAGVASLAMARLPIDPSQNATSSLYYSYIPGGSWELNALMESSAYGLGGAKDLSSTDGGDAYWLHEKGTNLTLAPAVQGESDIPSFSASLLASLVPERGGAATFTRASTATVMGYASSAVTGANQVLLTVAANEARFQGARRVSEGVWSKTLADGSAIPDATLLGYLAEGARTNLALQSATFDNASWSKVRSSITADATTAPDGTVAADKLVEDTTVNDDHSARQTITKSASAVTYTASVWAKSGERTRLRILGLSANGNSGAATFDVTGGQAVRTSSSGASPFTGLSATISAATVQGFYQCSFTFTTDTDSSLTTMFVLDNGSGTGADSTAYTGDGSSGVYIWGAQLEQAAFASTYIPTTTAAVTRNADALTYPSAGVVNTTANTFYAEVTTGAHVSGLNPYVIHADDGTGNNIVALLNDDSDSSSWGYIVSASVVQASIDDGASGSFGSGTTKRLALVAANNDARLYVDGVADGTADTSVTLPTVTTVRLGSYITSGAAWDLFGTIRNVRIWSSVLTAAQIAAQ